MGDLLAEDLSIEQIARELMDFDDANALDNSRERAHEEDRVGNIGAASRWRLIADAIQRLQRS